MRKLTLIALGALVAASVMPAANAEEVVVVKHDHHHKVERHIVQHHRVVERRIIRHIRHDHPHHRDVHKKVIIVR